VKIAEIMNWKAISLKPDDPIKGAAEPMSKGRPGGLPVVDDQGATFGALADADLGTVSRGDLTSVLAAESTVDPCTDAQALSEIKARLVQEAWISGRGFLY
jgi:predicted transcriptional regulator